MNYSIVSQPASEPLTLNEAKDHLRILHTETYDDNYISALIIAARNQVENMTYRALVSQQWKLSLNYSEVINLSDMTIGISKCPVISVESVKYYDSSGTQQTVDASTYQTDLLSEPANIKFTVKPTLQNRLNALEVNFTSGFSTSNPIPEAIKAAMKVMVADMYTNRETVVTSRLTELKTIQNLLAPYTLNWFYQ